MKLLRNTSHPNRAGDLYNVFYVIALVAMAAIVVVDMYFYG